MMHTLKVYLLCLPFTLLLDYLWLAKLMQGFYIRELGPYARGQGATIIPVYWAAAIVYLLLPLGIVLFTLPRVDPANLAVSSLLWGGLFGLVVYGVYDMTNMATLQNWPTRMVWVDIMTDKRTYQNLTGNRHAAFLFKTSGPGFSGVRLALELIKTEEEGDLLATIKAHTDEIVGPGAGTAVTPGSGLLKYGL